jgi:hypothetical protein
MCTQEASDTFDLLVFGFDGVLACIHDLLAVLFLLGVLQAKPSCYFFYFVDFFARFLDSFC